MNKSTIIQLNLVKNIYKYIILRGRIIKFRKKLGNYSIYDIDAIHQTTTLDFVTQLLKMAVHTGMELKMRPGNMAAEPYQAANQKQSVKYPLSTHFYWFYFTRNS